MKIIFLILILGFSIPANGQFLKKEEVPKIIQLKLDSLFPGNKFPVWKKWEGVTGRRTYTATFGYEHSRRWVKMNSVANIIEIEQEIDQESIPEKSKEYISKEYEIKGINGARKLTIDDSTFFYIRIQLGRTNCNLLFHEDGTFIDKKNNLNITFEDFATGFFEEFLSSFHSFGK